MADTSLDKELQSLGKVLHALEDLNETQRTFVLKTATERMNIKNVLPSWQPSHGVNSTIGAISGSPVVVSPTGDNQTPKQFLKAKLPKTDVLKVACLAFYLTNVRNQPHFKTQDLTKLNTEAGGTPFSNASMAVDNATKRNKYLASVGKGNKQITALGEDVVAALPNDEAVKQALASQPKPRKKRIKQARAKKT